MNIYSQILAESAPPGMEPWIKKNKDRFKKQYGKDWASYLYGTAWKIHNNEGLEEDLDVSGANSGTLKTPAGQRAIYRAKPVEESEKIKGGKGDLKTIGDIAKKHRVSLSDVLNQIRKGQKIESEHTKDKDKIIEIVKDHLWEIPDYYDRLVKMEKEAALDEEMVHPDDKIGNAMLKKMKVPQPFKSNKKTQTVSQKKVSEGLKFERGLTSKKALNIGISDFNDYVRKEFEKTPAVREEQFWSDFHYDMTHTYSKGDLVDKFLHTLKRTPLDYQINYFKDLVKDYIEQRNL